MSIKKLVKVGVSMVVTLAIVTGAVFHPVNLTSVEARAADSDEVLFAASSETGDTFRSDVVYENLNGNSMKLNTPADAYIVPEGCLQINYKSSTSATEDGSFTIWGEGGNYFGGDQRYVKFRLKATESDYASQFSVSFYNAGNNQGTYNFAQWLADSGYSEADIQSAVGDDFVDFRLTVPSTDSYQGMKIKFNQGNSTGTLWIDSITFGENSVFDNFDYDTNRGNYYIDENGNLPMYRPSTSLNGEYAGCNYASHLMWSVSTMMANLVNNNASAERALQIYYDTDEKSYAVLQGQKTFTDESLIALTMKGDVTANDCMYVNFISNGMVVDSIPFSDFTTQPGGDTKASISSDYQTVYASVDTGVSFDSIEFEFKGNAGIRGNVYITEVYFPRYSYTVEHYFDGAIDTSKNETYPGQKFGKSIENGFTNYSDTVYSVADIVYSDVSKQITGEADSIKVYYVSSVDYTINYYYDGVLDTSKTETGSDKIGTDITYTDKNITGYKFDHASAESITIGANAEDNVINVYYIKDSFGFTINYYYDGELDASKTETGTALYQAEIGYTDKNITGYKFDSASAQSITISEKEEENVINVYYVKDSFGYTVEYYYDGVIDDSKTESGTALYQSKITYTDKNKQGYAFVSASPAELTISEIAASNVIRVYYSKDSFPFTINYYYDGVLDAEKTINGSAAYQAAVSYEEKNITGYRFDHVSAESITISDNAEENVINVYYVKDSFGYTINYYYDNVIDDTKTETGTALYQSEIEYTDKNITGYELDRVSAEKIVISDNVDENVINVYYVKTSVNYTIEYYYDGVIDDSLTVNGTGLYGDTVSYEPQEKDGYQFVEASAENITLGDGENVIKVYYEKVPEETTQKTPEETTTKKTPENPSTALKSPKTGYTTSIAVTFAIMLVCMMEISLFGITKVRRKKR